MKNTIALLQSQCDELKELVDRDILELNTTFKI